MMPCSVTRRFAVLNFSIPTPGCSVLLQNSTIRLKRSAWKRHPFSSTIPKERLRKDDRQAFTAALAEYRAAMLYNADFAPQRYNLGNLASNLGDADAAIRAYKKAIEIDERFYPAKVNLAMLYNSLGKKSAAEKLLREVVEQEPEVYQVAYSLGLLLGELQQYDDAAVYLGKAAAGMPGNARVHYNLGQVLLFLNQLEQAETALLTALTTEPENQDFFIALANYISQIQPTRKSQGTGPRNAPPFSGSSGGGRTPAIPGEMTIQDAYPKIVILFIIEAFSEN